MSDVLEQLELSVRPLAEHRRREGLHDLLDRDRGVGELVLCGTIGGREEIGGGSAGRKEGRGR